MLKVGLRRKDDGHPYPVSGFFDYFSGDVSIADVCHDYIK
jgi:hypothetical protein